MFLVGDLLVRPFVSFLEILHDMAIEEMYDVDEIRDRLKENRLRYEIGELSESEYERRKADLEAELELAERAREQLRSKATVVQR